MMQLDNTVSPSVANPTPTTRHVLTNALIFNVLWLVTILGAAHAMPWLGVAAATAMLAGHLWAVTETHREIRLVILATALGFTADSGLAATGVLTYSSGLISSWLAPVWILSLWVAFATTLNVSFRWLQNRTVLAMVLGAISGPMSYYAGARLGAVTFPEPTVALISLSVTWAILLPVLLTLASRSNNGQPAPTAEVSHA